MEHTTKEEDLLRKEKQDALISPLSGAEALFLGASLETSDITAETLLEKLDQNNNETFLRQHNQGNSITNGRIKKSGSFHTAQGSNIDVDEFMSCAENASDIDSVGSNENSLNSHFPVRPFRIYMETIDDTISNNSSKTMASTLKKSKKSKQALPKKAPIEVIVEKKPLDVPPPTVTEDEPMKIDAAEAVYGKAKGILEWGKSVPVVSFFVGTSEAVAGKALGVVGTDLSSLDGKIESELTKFDTGVLTPAISAIAKILIGVAGKSEETIKPIIEAILKPLGFLIKSEADEPTPEAHTETPEVTVAK